MANLGVGVSWAAVTVVPVTVVLLAVAVVLVANDMLVVAQVVDLVVSGSV